MGYGSREMSISRRTLFQAGASAFAAPLLSPLEALTASKSRFRFVHFTDLHIQPELGAPDGVAMAVRKLLSLSPRPDFVLTGGDHVMDLLNVSHGRADDEFKKLLEALKPLEMPIHGVIGNHDVFGWGNRSADQRDALYGKKMVEEKFLGTPAYRSFDFGGWHFALLDGMQQEPKMGWKGEIDDAQLSWLNDDLEKAKGHPQVILSHFPAMTLFPQYTEASTAAASNTLVLANGKDIQQLCHKHKVKALLQGHTHVVEDCQYLETRYITGGAVCGDWWKGWRLGVHPEGFMVYDVNGDQLKPTYTPYGWDAKSYSPKIHLMLETAAVAG